MTNVVTRKLSIQRPRSLEPDRIAAMDSIMPLMPFCRKTPCHRYLERSHADAGGLDGQILAARFEEIQPNPIFRIVRIGCRDRVECAAQTSHGLAKEKIHSTSALTGIAQITTLASVSVGRPQSTP